MTDPKAWSRSRRRKRHTVGDSGGAEALLRVATVMGQVNNHPNLVALIGVVTSGTPLLLILSLCGWGSLPSVLKQSQTALRLADDDDRLRYALEIGRGMSHLVEHRFAHRDLAARNMLADAQNVCKIAAFGLSRATKASGGTGQGDGNGQAEYCRSQSGMFPVR